jgi:hypothetical protein
MSRLELELGPRAARCCRWPARDRLLSLQDQSRLATLERKPVRAALS